ncbi:MAG: hypothetical protein ACRCYR_18125 [Phycicoccus sp.]
MSTYYGYQTKRYGVSHAGHQIDIEFDKSRMVINQVRLFVDDAEVDRTNIWYGDKGLRATLADGTELEVVVHSGMVGELNRAQLRTGSDTFVDLTERT